MRTFQKIEDVADCLTQGALTRSSVTLLAHSRGTDQYNLELGEIAARVARRYLINHGVLKTRPLILDPRPWKAKA